MSLVDLRLMRQRAARSYNRQFIAGGENWNQIGPANRKLPERGAGTRPFARKLPFVLVAADFRDPTLPIQQVGFQYLVAALPPSDRAETSRKRRLLRVEGTQAREEDHRLVLPLTLPD